jgi:two-component system phosphate regulon sensor histidine kinase PhoR
LSICCRTAIKYSDDAKPVRWVEISGLESADGWCQIAVRDNGLGIPSDAVAKIFERFTRAHALRDDVAHVGGLGLGLSIVEDCVRAMHGRIEVESAEGVGTTFVLTLRAQHQRPRSRSALDHGARYPEHLQKMVGR